MALLRASHPSTLLFERTSASVLFSGRARCFAFGNAKHTRSPTPVLCSAPFACSRAQAREVKDFSQSADSDRLSRKAVLSEQRECDLEPRFVEKAIGLLQSVTLERWRRIFQGESGSSNLGKGVAGLLASCAFVTPGFGQSESLQSSYAPTMHDIVAGVVTMCGAITFLQIFKEMTKRGMIDQKLSRKLVHIFVGLGFVLFWPLFTAAPLAPYLAAFSVAANGLHILAVGLGLLHNDDMVKSISRHGNHRELLRGPMYYAVAIVVGTVVFWRTSPVGIIAIVNLCAGDGFADVIGRKFGTSKLPYNQEKSYAGSLAFFGMSSLISILYLSYFAAFGFITILPGTLLGVLLVSFLCALVESLPLSARFDDNLTVPLTAIVFGKLILPTG